MWVISTVWLMRYLYPIRQDRSSPRCQGFDFSVNGLSVFICRKPVSGCSLMQTSTPLPLPHLRRHVIIRCACCLCLCLHQFVYTSSSVVYLLPPWKFLSLSLFYSLLRERTLCCCCFFFSSQGVNVDLYKNLNNKGLTIVVLLISEDSNCLSLVKLV